eukprot:CAMPEP_0182450210 /NCGR_PEP_ID=MMETSP1172-20130603/39708_1 /TAXON_ID=708627 /ORGANISM="Timspurckia oligopyrenoides, Strain CCMP3278" /LENGTH=103 /DNA_ID=CAMNT_0024647739 /DNA_START=141 /DNA_END=448 /DNA_ORIENTATION=+
MNSNQDYKVHEVKRTAEELQIQSLQEIKELVVEKMTKECQDQLKQVLLRNEKVFRDEIGELYGHQHDLRVKPGVKPIKLRPYKRSLPELELERVCVNRLVNQG